MKIVFKLSLLSLMVVGITQPRIDSESLAAQSSCVAYDVENDELEDITFLIDEYSFNEPNDFCSLVLYRKEQDKSYVLVHTVHMFDLQEGTEECIARKAFWIDDFIQKEQLRASQAQ